MWFAGLCETSNLTIAWHFCQCEPYTIESASKSRHPYTERTFTMLCDGFLTILKAASKSVFCSKIPIDAANVWVNQGKTLRWGYESLEALHKFYRPCLSMLVIREYQNIRLQASSTWALGKPFTDLFNGDWRSLRTHHGFVALDARFAFNLIDCHSWRGWLLD